MKLGIIGGSGLYALPQLAAAHRISQETPWGWPSDALVEGRLEGLPVVFLPRHGPHHSIAPAEINYRANIAALKARGCTAILSVSACGSFTPDLPPGTLAVPHQIIDRTHGHEIAIIAINDRLSASRHISGDNRPTHRHGLKHSMRRALTIGG